MIRGLRNLAFTAHISFSVGWLGAVLAYLGLAIAALSRKDSQTVSAAYLAMELIGWFVIVPCSLAAVLTGLLQSLGTEWGLFRHYWILVKFFLTAFATIILLLHMPAVSYFAGLQTDSPKLGALPGELLHAGGGLLVLLVTTALSVYKPWGRTPYGRRKQQ
jgi:hypothetical protein